MGTMCAPLIANLFLYSYESEFLDSLVRSGHRKLARSFNLCHRYIDDLIVFNNRKFIDYVRDTYPSELNVEKANRWDDQANYLDLTFIIGNSNRFYTTLYDKRDDFNFHIVNFPFLSSNIPSGIYHMVFTFYSLSDMRDAAHLMMTLDIAIISKWTGSFLRAIKPTD